jgi:phosphohistidine phosphatase
MRLYLVQHGEAVPEEIDPARPLNDGGRADVRRMAAFLAQGGVRPDRIWHSGKAARRADRRDPGASSGAGEPTRGARGPEPEGSDRGHRPRARGVGSGRDVVGHLPFMARIASRLVAGRDDAGVVAFQPASVLCLEQADQQRWTIAWMLRPELLRLS